MRAAGGDRVAGRDDDALGPGGAAGVGGGVALGFFSLGSSVAPLIDVCAESVDSPKMKTRLFYTT